jgi:hypothetical protein
VSRKGKLVKVQLSQAERQRIREMLDLLSDPDVMAQIRESREHFAVSRPGVSFEELFGETVVPKRPLKS